MSVLPADMPAEVVHRVGTDGAPLPADENVSMFRPRDVYGLLRPRSVEEVRDIVRSFAGAPKGPGLHVFSTGRNWGLGSREPARDGAVSLDLSQLASVREFDLQGGWAVVEPGVTQLQLASLLEGSDRMLNVTASSGHTSVLGNTVDRGVGLRHQRTRDLAGLEVVLPDGELIRVGWWPRESGPTAVNPSGLGPNPLGLFTQSDLGVVTAAVVRLLPRPEAQRTLRASIPRRHLSDALDELRRWKAQHLVSGVIKVYDTVSNRSYGGAAGDFVAHLCVDGTAETVEALTRVIEGEAARCGLFSDIVRSDDHPPADDDFVAQLVQRGFGGDPSHNEKVLLSAVGTTAEAVDGEGSGWVFFLPLVPFNGPALCRAQEILEQVGAETGISPGSTINALDADVVDLVVSFSFPRTDTAVSRAHAALDLTYELFEAAGFLPYRLDAEHHAWTDRLSQDAAARRFVRRLKHVIDPSGVIAAGRYA
ncbi:FAD-binding oxidoreductase [Streptomyces sp. NBC_00683]|uniref:FAD-binding oxidoreductase n=1 Tax=Streptomyces sp. NBC_00683 TaxID=2903670 RepID=UPI002E35C257|nr:FAD-binding oxidoreductase [Streptomyces sp. NBC_00683]